MPVFSFSYHCIAKDVEFAHFHHDTLNGHWEQIQSDQPKISECRLTVSRSLMCFGKRVCIDRITNEMQKNSTNQQSIDPYDLCLPEDLTLCKNKSEEKNKCPQDYVINALSKGFLDLTCRLPDSAVNALLQFL